MARIPRGRRLDDEADLERVVREMRTIAVVGMKAGGPFEPAFSIPAMLRARGYRVIPVNPTVASALGEPAWPDVASVPERFDLVDVFRRPENLPAHVDEILALPADRRPRVVWLQSGIRNDTATEPLLDAGIDVVSDRCLGVYAGRYGRTGARDAD